MYRRISGAGMGPYLPRVRWALDVGQMSNPAPTLTPWALPNQRSADGGGTSTTCGAVSTRGTTIFSPGCWSCRCMEDFLIRRWDPIIPGYDETSTLARRASLPALWVYELQPISDWPTGVGFPRRAGRYRPDGILFSSPGCWNWRCMAGFLIQRWDVILPEYGGSSTLAKGTTLPARWFYEPQPISQSATSR